MPSSANAHRPKVLLIGPIPPPAFGVARATQLMLASPTLNSHWRLHHLDTTDVHGFARMGRLGWGNVALGIRHLTQLLWLEARIRPEVTLLTISVGKFALYRDGLFVLVARLFRSRVVAYLRGSGYADVRAKQGRLAGWVLRSILRHSSRVIVLGHSLIGMAREVWPHVSLAVVPNGCPPILEATNSGTRDPGRPLLIYIGRLSSAKGLTDLIAAAGDVIRSLPSVECVFCGEWISPQYEAEMLGLIRKRGLMHSFRFPGPIDEEAKVDLLARAHVLAVPSHSEGQPWVILEAMSAGVPVVATATGAIAETVADGKTGFVVPVGDKQALADKLNQLLRDDQLRSSMSETSVARHRQFFTAERVHSLLASEVDAITRHGTPAD